MYVWEQLPGTGNGTRYIMADFEEHSSQFFYHWMGAMASSQDIEDTEPMDVQNEVSLLVSVLVLI